MSCDDSVAKLRAISRAFLREFGILSKESPYEISLTARHVLLEIGIHGALTHTELATLLNLEKSAVSHLIKSMLKDGIVEVESSLTDRRFKFVKLTGAGKKLLAKVHSIANHQVNQALEKLTLEEQSQVIHGFNLYVKALKKTRLQNQFQIRKIQVKDNLSMSLIIKETLKEHNADKPGTAFMDSELKNLYKAYSENNKAYFVIERISDKKLVGGAGIGPLNNGNKNICELKKMYFLPEARGLGLGKVLIEKILDNASILGYKKCYLETIATMTKAKNLYAKLGFKRLTKPIGATGHFGCDQWMIRKI